MGQDVDAAREAFATVPPGRSSARRAEAADPSAGGSGPHAPGPVSPESEAIPETGGYNTRPATPRPDNRKGGHGAG